jgi:hypothetical protein
MSTLLVPLAARRDLPQQVTLAPENARGKFSRKSAAIMS